MQEAGAGDAALSDATAQDATETGGPVNFAVDVTKGPARQFAPPASPQLISDYVYGINAGLDGTAVSVKLVSRATRWGMVRQGGDAYSSWNWTNNYNNAGSDYCFAQGPGLGGTAVAGAITVKGDTIAAAQAKGEAFLATVPITDYVAAAYDNGVAMCPVTGTFCNGTTSSTRVNEGGLPFPTDPDGGEGASPAFVSNVAIKPGGDYCSCPDDSDAGCEDGGCTLAASPVYEDEFVNFIETNYADGGAPVFFSLDNEPNYWGGTHPELWPWTGTLPCQTYTVTYDDIVDRDTTFASAIKAVWPTALVFGPVVAQDGIVYAHAYLDPHWPTEFLDYYLQQIASASADAGQPLLDVVDVHYYTNNGSPAPGPAQCVQSPRLFWDPDYTSLSPTQTDDLDFGYAGQNDYFNSHWYPRRLIPRLLEKIANAYSDGGSAPPQLSISEYNNGCESDISGGVAQADVLGVFGREGVFAASAWPLESLTDNYLVAAFDLYRNYDGNGTVVGDTAVQAISSDVVDTSIYAFAHSEDASALDLVAINKTNSPVTASIEVAGASGLSQASAFQLVGAAAAVAPVSGALPVSCAAGACTLGYVMPPMSATTLALR
ncbi:MAG TPA: glycoside hydrolase family 44 protein [Polyangiaceae bacterium]|nr:glycoside hydrolase family 44 protein [Polyangiaceae bacterium]